MTAGSPARLDDVQRDERLFAPAEGLSDDEVHVCLDGPRDLLLEHPTHCFPGGIVADEDVRVADVAGEQGARVVRDLLRDRERAAVHLLEQVLLVDDLQLLAVGVVRERLDDVGARVHELAVQLGDELRVLEHDLRHERARLQ